MTGAAEVVAFHETWFANPAWTYAVVNVNTLDGVDHALLRPVTVSFDGEDESSRLKRRMRGWIGSVRLTSAYTPTRTPAPTAGRAEWRSATTTGMPPRSSASEISAWCSVSCSSTPCTVTCSGV